MKVNAAIANPPLTFLAPLKKDLNSLSCSPQKNAFLSNKNVDFQKADFQNFFKDWYELVQN